ncbi:hypothetical protein DFQ09_10899 [Winogradskyella pacifica]|uniref:Uncharacterized protein n=1 Tax=Winogradskyella pacifica TaxID=664642 RepID=A0A3D9LQJ4_9FLAO|nr:hypothetical protein DFQ09_10899 [Winogradskyella pacifica]
MIKTFQDYNIRFIKILLPTTYNLQPTTYNLQPTTYNLQPTTYNLQPTTYNLQPTTYNQQPTTNYISSLKKIAFINNLLVPYQKALKLVLSVKPMIVPLPIFPILKGTD